LKFGKRSGSVKKVEMENSDFYKEVAYLAGKDFEKPQGELLPVSQDIISRETIKARLEEVIFQMLSNEFEKLCNVMYRLDVSEAKFNTALLKAPEDAVSEIADLVIDREIQKVKTRELYRKKKL
jgi:hypothetical protein